MKVKLYTRNIVGKAEKFLEPASIKNSHGIV